MKLSLHGLAAAKKHPQVPSELPGGCPKKGNTPGNLAPSYCISSLTHLILIPHSRKGCRVGKQGVGMVVRVLGGFNTCSSLAQRLRSSFWGWIVHAPGDWRIPSRLYVLTWWVQLVNTWVNWSLGGQHWTRLKIDYQIDVVKRQATSSWCFTTWMTSYSMLFIVQRTTGRKHL